MGHRIERCSQLSQLILFRIRDTNREISLPNAKSGMTQTVDHVHNALRQAKREKQAEGIRAYQSKHNSTERRDPGRSSQPHVAEVLYRPRVARTDLTNHPILKLPCLPIPRYDNNRNRASRAGNEISLDLPANSFP